MQWALVDGGAGKTALLAATRDLAHGFQVVSARGIQSEAALAIAKIDATLPVEEIIKLALRSMAGRR